MKWLAVEVIFLTKSSQYLWPNCLWHLVNATGRQSQRHRAGDRATEVEILEKWRRLVYWITALPFSKTYRLPGKGSIALKWSLSQKITVSTVFVSNAASSFNAFSQHLTKCSQSKNKQHVSFWIQGQHPVWKYTKNCLTHYF